MCLLLLISTGGQSVVDYYQLRDVMFSKVEQRAAAISEHLAMRSKLDNDFGATEAAQAVTREAVWNDDFLAIYLIDQSGRLLKGDETSQLGNTDAFLNEPDVRTAINASLLLERPQSFEMTFADIDGRVYAAAVPGEKIGTITFVDLRPARAELHGFHSFFGLPPRRHDRHPAGCALRAAAPRGDRSYRTALQAPFAAAAGAVTIHPRIFRKAN